MLTHSSKLRCGSLSLLSFIGLLVTLAPGSYAEGCPASNSQLALDMKLSASAAAPVLARNMPHERGELDEWQQALAKELTRVIQSSVEHEECAGLSVAIAIEDEYLVRDGFGFADLEHGIRADASTLFRIGSVTKQFTAAAIMRYVERGTLDLEGEMHQFLPTYPETEHPVTLRQLLTHTSGIPSYTAQPDWQETILEAVEPEGMAEYISGIAFDFEPDERFSYNNSGYFLLGLILEQASEVSYAEHLDAELFPLAELKRTRVGARDPVIQGRAQGYAFRGGQFFNDQPISMTHPYAAGNILSSAAELVQWQHALTRGDVVSFESYEQMITPHTLSNGNKTTYGFGLGVGKVQDFDVVRHSGGINGFNSILIWVPDFDLSVAVISNSEAFDAPDFGSQLTEQVLAAILLREAEDD
ncbi:MAG: D-alanyl-D-alanine carboxypeptidase [Planctomycetota bacterium]|jgi:D-alanyl-D-alanine carboxypeptidase